MWYIVGRSTFHIKKTEEIPMKRTAVIAAAAVLAASTLLSGCATDQMKQDIAEARAVADEANAKADAAAAKADMAMDTAQEAQSCCNANSEKIDRMFRKAMMK
jgi:predicted small secreted protein